MIDIHSHIIPGIDDGSGSIEESFNMINEANEVGFTDIILTPHFLLNHYEPSITEINELKDRLQELLIKNQSYTKLYTGMEFYISNNIEEIIHENRILNLNDSKYLLLELPLSTSITYLDYVLFFLNSIGIKPILAHPERYKYVQENPKLVEEYINKGSLIQCNYGSILGIYGRKAKKTFKKILKDGHLHFLGSDCHKEKSIYPLVPKAAKRIKRIIGDRAFQELSVDNPQKVLKKQEWK